MTRAPNLLTDLLSRDYLAAKGVDRATSINIRSAFRNFERFLGRTATTDDLDVERIEAFTLWRTKDVTESTAKTNRAIVLRVWRHLAEIGTVPPPPKRSPPTAPQSELLRYIDIVVLETDICDEHAHNLRKAVRSFERFLGRLANWRDLTDQSVNGWIVHELDRGLSPYTVKSRRGDLLRLWRYAVDAGLTSIAPARVRVVKCPELIPHAFLTDELKALTKAAKRMRGEYHKVGIPRRLWWGSFLRAQYDTALRLGDLLRLEKSQIGHDGYVLLVQHKTGHRHRVQFRPSTLALIEKCWAAQPDRRLIWPMFCTRENFSRAFNRLRELAGLPQGTSKWIRRSSASYVEEAYPGMASHHLGHRSPDQARRHYLDLRIVGYKTVIPPTSI